MAVNSMLLMLGIQAAPMVMQAMNEAFTPKIKPRPELRPDSYGASPQDMQRIMDSSNYRGY